MKSTFLGLSLICGLTVQTLIASAQPNALSYDVNVTESIIENDGMKYRKVEYKGDIFYMRLLESEADTSNPEIYCAQTKLKNPENQVLISTKVLKRSSLYIEGLRKTCSELQNGQKQINIDANIKIGFLLDESKTDILKNKKVYWQPNGNIFGFGAEF